MMGLRTYIYAVLLVISSLSCLHPGATTEIYLIPKGFTGRVSVVFNQKEGVPLKYEDGAIVYDIPADGVCLTQSAQRRGIRTHKYFYIDSNNNRTSLRIFRLKNENPDGVHDFPVTNKDSIGIFFDGSVGNYANDDAAQFQTFYVCSYKDFDGFFTKQYKDAHKKNLEEKTGLKIYIP